MPRSRRYSIADPRYTYESDYCQLGVRDWAKPTGTITGQRTPIQERVPLLILAQLVNATAMSTASPHGINQPVLSPATSSPPVAARYRISARLLARYSANTR